MGGYHFHIWEQSLVFGPIGSVSDEIQFSVCDLYSAPCGIIVKSFNKPLICTYTNTVISICAATACV